MCSDFLFFFGRHVYSLCLFLCWTCSHKASVKATCLSALINVLWFMITLHLEICLPIFYLMSVKPSLYLSLCLLFNRHSSFCHWHLFKRFPLFRSLIYWFVYQPLGECGSSFHLSLCLYAYVWFSKSFSCLTFISTSRVCRRHGILFFFLPL